MLNRATLLLRGKKHHDVHRAPFLISWSAVLQLQEPGLLPWEGPAVMGSLHAFTSAEEAHSHLLPAKGGQENTCTAQDPAGSLEPLLPLAAAGTRPATSRKEEHNLSAAVTQGRLAGPQHPPCSPAPALPSFPLPGGDHPSPVQIFTTVARRKSFLHTSSSNSNSTAALSCS